MHLKNNASQADLLTLFGIYIDMSGFVPVVNIIPKINSIFYKAS